MVRCINVLLAYGKLKRQRKAVNPYPDRSVSVQDRMAFVKENRGHGDRLDVALVDSEGTAVVCGETNGVQRVYTPFTSISEDGM